jgi:HTH-type transcriptional regulator, sugar sensing transcriptional regulator
MLEEFGLTETEEKVYISLAKLGQSPASEIIKKTQLHRTTIYDVLERLIEKGLISFVIKNKIKYYLTGSPSKFEDLALEDKNKAENKLKLAKQIMNELSTFKKEDKEKLIVQLFVGDKGFKTVMDDIINEGKDYFILGSEGKLSNSLPTYAEQWAEKRRKKKIKAKIIYVDRANAPKWKLNEIRYIPKEYSSPTSTTIYGKKVLIFLDESPVSMILIESEKVAKTYKNYFDLLWKIAKK